MSIPTPESKQAYFDLAEYLRQNPGSVRNGPASIAAESGISESVVREVLSTARAKEHTPPPRKTGLESYALRDFSVRVTKLVKSILQRPIVSILVTSILAVVLSVIVSFALPGVVNTSRGIQIDSLAIGLIWLLLVVLHYGLYFAKGMARYPLWGALLLWGLLTVTVISVSMVDTRQFAPLLAVAMLLLCTMYAIGGLFFAVLGGYSRIRWEESRQAKLSRQELLERLLDVQERLGRVGQEQEVQLGWREWAIIRNIVRKPYLSAAVLMFGLSLLEVLLVGAIQTRSSGSDMSQVVIGLVSFFVGCSSLLAQATIAFLSGSVRRAIAVTLIATLVSVPPQLIPLGDFGPKYITGDWPGLFLASFCISMLIGIFAGLGAQIEERASRQRKLKLNDPATLVAELAQLQMLLNPQSGNVTVLVVDAAKSSRMKAEADPYVAEWSFREYQNLIALACHRFFGRVHATAGDGAVVTFDDPKLAFESAVELQVAIENFNRTVNRLPSPFRLRIGLHSGNVVGAIDEVQFTEVIDIAAHIEAKSPVGGVAVSAPVYEALGDSRFRPIDAKTDGYDVFILSPEDL